MAVKYINPFTDFGFKKLFGEEANKDILIDFLNELLREEQGEIVDLTFKKTEQLGAAVIDRKAIFDIYCENEKGEKFIVEMQKAKHNFFKDRSVFYSTFPIREQAEKGDWDYKLKAVYTIAILDFIFDEDKEDKDKFLYRVKLSDIETHKVFYDKLTFIYIEMPKFNKTLEECKTKFDKWLYVIKNLERFDSYPEELQEKIFEKFFGEAALANLTREELDAYDESLKIYRDLKGCIDTAYDEGVLEGIQKMKNHLDKLKEEKRMAEEREQRLEEEKRMAEERERRLEEEKRLAEERERKLEEEKQKMRDLLKSMGLSEDEISEKLK